MNFEMISGLIRHILTALGTLAVTKGIFDAGMAEQIIGVVMTIVGLGWSFWQKKNAVAEPVAPAE